MPKTTGTTTAGTTSRSAPGGDKRQSNFFGVQFVQRRLVIAFHEIPHFWDNHVVGQSRKGHGVHSAGHVTVGIFAQVPPGQDTFVLIRGVFRPVAGGESAIV